MQKRLVLVAVTTHAAPLCKAASSGMCMFHSLLKSLPELPASPWSPWPRRHRSVNSIRVLPSSLSGEMKNGRKERSKQTWAWVTAVPHKSKDALGKALHSLSLSLLIWKMGTRRIPPCDSYRTVPFRLTCTIPHNFCGYICLNLSFLRSRPSIRFQMQIVWELKPWWGSGEERAVVNVSSSSHFPLWAPAPFHWVSGSQHWRFLAGWEAGMIGYLYLSIIGEGCPWGRNNLPSSWP